jgi:hypothetical protein
MIKIYEYLPWVAGVLAVLIAWGYDSRTRRRSPGDADPSDR